MKSAFGLISIIVLVFIALPLQASVTYSFSHIVEPGDTASQLADGTIGEAQLFVEVSDIGGNQVLFNFSNTGPEPSIITDIYFDDDASLFSGIGGLIDADDGIGGDPDVDFSEGASPSDLPGGENVSPTFEVTTGLLTDADPPPGTGGSGIDPGESLGVILNLQGGLTYDDTIDSLDDSSLRIGIHVQGFESGGSEAFVNDGRTPPTVPVPGAIVLGTIGIAGVGYLRRKTF